MTIAKSAVLNELLGAIVDYAGLFPPAGLSMSVAVENYARYGDSDEAWMLGSFVLPAARLPEFAEIAEPWLERAKLPWSLSLLLAEDGAGDLRAAMAQLEGRSCRIASVECKSSALERDAAKLPPQLDAFFEIAPGPGLGSALDFLASARRFAKIRTGSVRSEEIPTARVVAEFIDACAGHRVPFKATAGLHHPLRGEHALHYEAGAPCARMHGFLNLFLAAALCEASKHDVDAMEALLEEESVESVRLEADGVSIGAQRLTLDEIAAGRRFARSFGSCSFEEPVDDLRRMGWL